MTRVRIKEGGGSYFAAPAASIDFIPSGCTLLDCALGGGYPVGRLVNIVGDKSTGKTLLAIEAAANFASKFKKGHIVYNEVEAAFDVAYADALGMPTGRVEFYNDCVTVEELFEDLSERIAKSEEPTLYILDSLDALSDKAEFERDIDEGTYAMTKAKKLSELFRRTIKPLEESNITLMIISQIRDKIGVSFGARYARSGGRALDFYASQVMFLSQTGTESIERNSIKRAVGLNIRAKVTKNKIGLPQRECDFPLLFGFGVEDVIANLNFLKGIKSLDETGLLDKDVTFKKLRARLEKMDVETYRELNEQTSEIVREKWYDIETEILPKRRKY